MQSQPTSLIKLKTSQALKNTRFGRKTKNLKLKLNKLKVKYNLINLHDISGKHKNPETPISLTKSNK